MWPTAAWHEVFSTIWLFPTAVARSFRSSSVNPKIQWGKDSVWTYHTIRQRNYHFWLWPSTSLFVFAAHILLHCCTLSQWSKNHDISQHNRVWRHCHVNMIYLWQSRSCNPNGFWWLWTSSVASLLRRCCPLLRQRFMSCGKGPRRQCCHQMPQPLRVIVALARAQA